MNATRALCVAPLLLLLAVAGSEAAAARDGQPTTGAPRVLYSSDWSGTYQIYAVDPARRRPPAQLTFGRPASCLPANPCGFVDPVASPDGRYVLFWDFVLQGTRRRSLFVARADGRNPRRLASVAGFVPEAVWSPDSRRVAFGSDSGAWIVGVNGSGRRRLSTRSARELAWSPTGAWIGFGSDDLFVVRPDGRNHRRLSDESVHDLTWSPNGRLLAVAGNGVRVLQVATGRTRTVTIRSTHSVAWSPDGHLLAYASDSDGIWAVDVASGVGYRLSGAASPGVLAWSPDGRRLVLVRQTRGFYRADQLTVVDFPGLVRFTVFANAEHGGAFAGATWTRPPATTRYRPPAVRSLATGIGSDSLTARWPIQRLAADGHTVAFVACGHAFAWTPAERVVEQTEPQASLSPRCNGSTFFAGVETYSLAIAEDRVAFGLIGGGNTRFWWLGGSRTSFGRFDLPIAEGNGSAAGPTRQDFESDLVGAGSLMAFGSADSERNVVTSQEILRVEENGCPCPVIAMEPGPFVPYDVDEGRIAAAGDNAVVLLDADGTRLLNVFVRARSAQLAGRDLVVAVEGALRHYAAATGALLHKWPLAAGSSLQDARRGLVAYVLGGEVHILRLGDGADATVARGGLVRFLDAGLVYADGARLRLVPFDELPLR